MGKQIEKIWQIDNTHFGIIWNDGKEMEYSLRKLQESCPCARCQTKTSDGVNNNPCPDTTAESIESVGLYALRIRFQKGCSLGIYDFESLYSMGLA